MKPPLKPTLKPFQLDVDVDVDVDIDLPTVERRERWRDSGKPISLMVKEAKMNV